MEREYVVKNSRKLRCGYTTGVCAQGAAKAGAMILLGNKTIKTVEVFVPRGDKMILQVEDVWREGNGVVTCGIRKDGGDDIDATHRLMIYARVEIKPDTKLIIIDGGEGVGRVTRPGLDQPVGSAAINSTPRKCIEQELMEVRENFQYSGGFEVTILVPGGEEAAKKTFNSQLGIEGGISILGTSGIVEPMSDEAIIDTIRAEISMLQAEGEQELVITPGNFGQAFIEKCTSVPSEQVVKCSNFIGKTIDIANELGFHKIMLIGHIGKFVKLGAGIMNTHSSFGDGRMEILTACCIQAGGNLKLCRQVLSSNTCDEAIEHLEKADMKQKVLSELEQRIYHYVSKRAGEKMEIQLIVFSNIYGRLF